jgi:hypothetical protein
MKILELILYVLAFFTTFLWISKLVTDSVSSLNGVSISDDDAEKDGMLRTYLFGIASVLWAVLITFFN